MIFCNIRTDFNFIFGQFSVARKLILNGGAIRPIGLLLLFMPDYFSMFFIKYHQHIKYVYYIINESVICLNVLCMLHF